MTKIRKQRRRKSYHHDINRKKLRKKHLKKGKIQCKEIENEWEEHRSVRTNLRYMGLSNDPNTTLKIPSTKEKYRKEHILNEEPEEGVPKRIPKKIHVAETLEAEAKAPRARRFRLPNKEVEWLSYLMDKYGKDYKSMANDKKNYYQQTWKQIRAKIKQFKGIPEQYSVYLEKRNRMETDSEQESDVSSDGEL